MAIFRPAVKASSEGSKYYGICKAGIVNFTDKSNSFDWADLFIEIDVKQEGSDYTKKLQICGEYERDASGNISGGTVLTRLYRVFDTIGCKAGINLKGGFEDESGNAITDIATYLNDRFTTGDEVNYDSPYLIYVYKSVPKPNESQSYTRVLPRLVHDNPEGKKSLENDVKYMKTKGWLKELDESKPANGEGSKLAGAVDL